ncbi:succinate dehydrogenase [Jonquetella anthropi]|uniref:succinate dehydrogenase n=1 Tax=Jonquetella anthropi TaxID=428712 RepID=UPI0023559B38|nr:succinate dehydrogenase [Jonquetella anthropi]
MFHNLPPLNVQTLLGVASGVVTFLLVKVINACLSGRMPSSPWGLIWLRVLLGFFAAAALWLVGAALLGRVVI